MTNMMKILGICALVLGMQYGLGLMTVLAAPVAVQPQQIEQQEAAYLALKQQEILRHEQAMLQRENESVADWQWRQFLEREQHILNMQKIQRDGMILIGTPVNW